MTALEGCYVTVSANAGANDVAYGGYSTSYVGPFKQAGAVDIYSALLAPAGSESGSYVYCVGDTVRALGQGEGRVFVHRSLQAELPMATERLEKRVLYGYSRAKRRKRSR